MSQTQKPVLALASGVAFESLSIQSDGTVSGTVIKVNGKAIDNVSSIYFSLWHDKQYNYHGISFEYAQAEVADVAGMMHKVIRYCLVPPIDQALASLVVTNDCNQPGPVIHSNVELMAKIK